MSDSIKVGKLINEAIEKPEIDSQLYNQLIFNKDSKGTQWEKENIFNKRKKTSYPYGKKKNLTLYRKINSRWILDINIEAAKI